MPCWPGWGLDCLVDEYSRAPSEIFRVFIRRAGWGMASLVLFSGMLMGLLHFRFGMGMDHPYITGVAALATYLTVLGFLIFLLHTGAIRPAVFQGLILALLVWISLRSFPTRFRGRGARPKSRTATCAIPGRLVRPRNFSKPGDRWSISGSMIPR